MNLPYAIIDTVDGPKTWLRWITLAAAVFLLNASLTFLNAWPTPAIRWRGALSIELAVLILVLAWASQPLGPPSRAALRWLGALWVLLVLGHYADVTAPALYGREINLYWDLRFVPAVVALLARPERLWIVALAAVAALLILVLLYRLLRWGLGRIGDAMADASERRTLAAIAAVIAALFVGQRMNAAMRGPLPPGAHVPGDIAFPGPVIQTYMHQARLMAATLSGSRSLARSPSMNSDLALVRGADVLLVFLESYGAVSYERPEFAARLAESRAQLEAAIHDTHRDVVSAYVESPTFGGSSWLAHISLLSGVDVRDHDTNAVLMTQKRDTLVTTFERHGYRTVALMPGTWQDWPEGSFYGFDEIYSGARLDYRGPPFGWWDMTDQFAIARIDALEVNRPSRAPLFVFFPTISTHIPFTPTPPYQPDWPRMLTDRPYDDAALDRAYNRQPDWLNLGPSYADALAYAYETLTGYLRMHADSDFVMILLGDHQPAAAVTGEGAPWDVPVHVVASRHPILDRLLAHGFRPGLMPERPRIGRMHGLARVLLDALGDREPAVTRAP